MLKSGLPHWGIQRMEVMLPISDWVLGGLLHQVGSSEGGVYHPYQNGVPASEVCFSSTRQTSAGGSHSSCITPEGGHICSVIRASEQVLSLMVPGHPSSLLLPDRSYPRGGLCPSRECRTEGWGRIGWLLLRGEQRTLLSSPPHSPRGPGRVISLATHLLLPGMGPSLVPL